MNLIAIKYKILLILINQFPIYFSFCRECFENVLIRSILIIIFLENIEYLSTNFKAAKTAFSFGVIIPTSFKFFSLRYNL